LSISTSLNSPPSRRRAALAEIESAHGRYPAALHLRHWRLTRQPARDITTNDPLGDPPRPPSDRNGGRFQIGMGGRFSNRNTRPASSESAPKPQDDYEFSERWVDFLLLLSIGSYEFLGQKKTEDMIAFTYWFSMKYPHWLKKDHPFTELIKGMCKIAPNISKKDYYMACHTRVY
jgi:hypothetical protein